MLSALPIAAPQATQFGQVSSLQLMSASSITPLQNLSSLDMRFVLLGSSPSTSITNAYGNGAIPPTPAGDAHPVVLPPLGGPAVDSGDLGGELPVLAPAQPIDPISAPPPFIAPESAPISSLPTLSLSMVANAPSSSSASDSSGAADSYPTSGPIAAPVAISQPAAPPYIIWAASASLGNSTATAITPAIAGANTSGYSPRWLSATFSAAEEHRLDAPAMDAHDCADCHDA